MSAALETMNELTLPERVSQALAIQHTEAELRALAAKHTDITEIKDDDDYTLVKSAGIELKTVRVSIEKAGKLARDDANTFSKAVIAEQKRLVAIINGEEDRLKALRKEVDDREKHEAEQLRAVEEQRINTHKARLYHLAGLGTPPAGTDCEGLEARLKEAKSNNPDDFEEFNEAAGHQINVVTDILTKAITERREFERLQVEQIELQAKIKAEEAAITKRNEEDRKEMAEQQAKIDKEREEIAAERQRIEDEAAAAKKHIEDEKLEAERAEAAKVKAEEDARKKSEAERIAAEKAAAESKAAQARQEAMLPDKQKLEELAESLINFTPKTHITDSDCEKLFWDTVNAVRALGENLMADTEEL